MYCSERQVRVPLIGDAVHDDVDFLVFQVEIALRPVEVILAVIDTRRKIQSRINWEYWVLARQPSVDVRVVAISASISPEIVVFCFETLNERDVVGKINGFVNVIAVWCG